MRLLVLFQALWRRRLIVAVGLCVAFMAALLITYRLSSVIPPQIESRHYQAGIASTELLVDSPRSQVVDLGGENEVGGDMLGTATDLIGLSTRAHLIANLMANSPLKERIAGAAGIAQQRLVVTEPSGDGPDPTALPAPKTTVRDDRRTTVMDLSVNETLPIISISVRAPDAATARRAASAAASELRTHLATLAAAGSVPGARQLTVSQVGPASSETIVKGPRRLFSIVAFLLLASLWCIVVLLSGRIAKIWRWLLAESAGGTASPPTRG